MVRTRTWEARTKMKAQGLQKQVVPVVKVRGTYSE
jgi:hypothetical protein